MEAWRLPKAEIKIHIPMVNKPLIRPYCWGGVALGGVARIPMNTPGRFVIFFCLSSFLIEKFDPFNCISLGFHLDFVKGLQNWNEEWIFLVVMTFTLIQSEITILLILNQNS